MSFFFSISIKPFSPSSSTTIDLIPTASTTNALTTRFISSNRLKLAEFAAYVESKRGIDSVRNSINFKKEKRHNGIFF